MQYSGCELQSLVFYFRSMDKLRVYLEMDSKTFKATCLENGVVPAPEYIRKLSLEELKDQVALYRSVDGLAKYYGVSGSLVNTILIEKGLAKPTQDLSRFDETLMVSELTRVGNLSIMAHLNGVSESALRNKCKDLGVEPLDFVQIGHSNSTTERGRKAELLWKQTRGECILEDMNLVDPHSEHDFVDSEIGKVDVKSSPLRMYKTKSRQGHGFWNIRLCNLTPGVKIVVALMNEDLTELVHWAVLDTVPEQSGLLIRTDQFPEFDSSKGYPVMRFEVC